MKQLIVLSILVTLTPSITSSTAAVAATVTKAAPKSAGSTTSNAGLPSGVSEALKKNIKESEPKLGSLEVWQSKLFQDEVIPQFQTFISDYRNTSKGVVADVDLVSIKKYLAFFAPLKLGAKDNSICISYSVEANCPKCKMSEESVKLLVMNRLARRGFKLNWKGESCLSQTPSQFQLNLKRIPLAEADEGHEDDRGYRVEAKMVIDGSDQSRKIELLENDSFDTSVGNILTEFFMEFGTRSFGAAGVTAARTETWIQIDGLKSFAEFSSAKATLTQIFGSVQERKMSFGKATFAIPMSASIEDVKSKLEGKFESQVKVNVTEGGK